jgi:DNA-binding response OmpR family regulator
MVMTSMTALEERSWARGLADTEFLEKPLSPRQLVARLARHFAALPAAPEHMHAI